MPNNDFLSEFDASAASPQSVETSPVAANTAAPPPTENNQPAEQPNDTAEQQQPEFSRELLDSFDDIGTDAPAPSENLSPTPEIEKSVSDSQKETEQKKSDDPTDKTDKTAEGENEPAAPDKAADDWENLTPDEEAEKENLPKGKWDSFQKKHQARQNGEKFLKSCRSCRNVAWERREKITVPV